MKFAKISAEAFKGFQLGAGVVLNGFDPATGEFADENIVTATSGGISITCIPKVNDMGTDVDNCPEGVVELMKIIGYDCGMGFSALEITPETIALALGCADISKESNVTKIAPRSRLEITDAKDVWWVGDRADGGMAAACLKRAWSSGGLTLQSAKNGKNPLSVSLTGYRSISDPDEVPMDFYVSEGAEAVAASVDDDEIPEG